MPQIRCPYCSKPMQTPDNVAGKTVRCPSCNKNVPVPALQPVAALASAVEGPAFPQSAIGNGARGAPAAPSKCPACGSTLLEGAVACMDCGYLLQGDNGEPEGPPNLCINPACGVANPPGERVCGRCGTALPLAGGTLLHGRYRLDKLLAQGGFGTVYLATDVKQNNRLVAVKDMLSDDPQEFEIRLNFFRREAEILRSLASVPIVPRVFEFVHQGQSAHLVMEFIRGNDLLKVMEARGNKPFAIAQVIEWGKNICDVLTTMHTQSPPIIHRDLKPDNIMLLDDQKSIKMIDFGTARDLGRTARERMAGKTRVYTEGYAPPEQIVGKPEARSDLFALAATLYHLATGKTPEGFYTAKELEAQIAQTPSSLPANYLWFYELLKINLSEDINDRYFSAREIKNDLERQTVTQEVACPKCKALNKVRTPYCGKCAEPLTEQAAACTMCGKYNRMGGRCCIHCGNRLR